MVPVMMAWTSAGLVRGRSRCGLRQTAKAADESRTLAVLKRVGICLGGEVGSGRFGDDRCRLAADRGGGGRLEFGFGVGWLGAFA